MKLTVTGAGGMLGADVVLRARARGHDVIALSHRDLDVEDRDEVRAQLTSARPDAVVFCAGYTAVDLAEEEEDRAQALNARAAGMVAEECTAIGARMLYPSTDYVFDGATRAPYAPDAPPRPLGAYGRSKLAGEAAAHAAGGHLVVRTSWLYGSGGKNFVRTILDRAAAGDAVRVVDDQHGAPSWTADVADAMVRLIEIGAAGVWHATNAGAATWYELARVACELAGVPAEIRPVPTREFQRPARRPHYSVLDCTKTEAVIGPMRPWREALEAALAQGLWSAARAERRPR